MLTAGLEGLLGIVNRWRLADRTSVGPRAVEWLLDRLFGASARLAVYGSLAPGGENHHVLAELDGEWLRGTVAGRHEEVGWGTSLGYPALRWDPTGQAVPVWVLSAGELVDRWPQLDRFEGPDYVRSLIPVFSQSRLLCIANIYLAR